MDELKYGTKNKRGDFAPKEHLQIAPYFEFPPSPVKLLKFLKGYLFPWNIMYMALALLFWFYLTPDVETTKTLAPGWIAFILVRNAILVFVIYGLLELRLYIQRGQGNRFKFHGQFPARQTKRCLHVQKPEHRQHHPFICVRRPHLDSMGSLWTV